MNFDSNREAFIEFRNGVLFVLAVLTGAALFLALFLSAEKPRAAKFEVVDHYKQCDVVRYVDPSNRWNYFLDCSE